MTLSYSSVSASLKQPYNQPSVLMWPICYRLMHFDASVLEVDSEVTAVPVVCLFETSDPAERGYRLGLRCDLRAQYLFGL